VGGITELGFNLPVLIAQIVNVALLFGLMYLVAYKPIMRMLDHRSKRIEEDMGQRVHIEAERAQIDEKATKILEDTRQEGQRIIAQALKAGEEAKQKIHEQAKQESKLITDLARFEIQQEREEAIKELHREFADLTIEAAGKVIERTLDKQAHLELIYQVLEKSETFRKN